MKRKMNGMRMVLGGVRPRMARNLDPKGKGQNVSWGPSSDNPRLVVGLPCAVRDLLMDLNCLCVLLAYYCLNRIACVICEE